MILIRHGETLENVSRIVQGHCPGTLTEKGKKQASMMGCKFRNASFDAVYSSDLDRALQTADIFVENRGDIPLIIDQRLREQHFGVYEGKPLFFLLRQLKRENADLAAFDPEGGESAADFRNRVTVFFEEIKEKHWGRNVVLVTHHGVIRAIMDYVLAKTGRCITDNRILNGTPIILDMDLRGNILFETIECLNEAD